MKIMAKQTNQLQVEENNFAPTILNDHLWAYKNV